MKTCYCHIPQALLIRIVKEKFVDRIPTMELLKLYSTKQERRYVQTIALLDVPETEIRDMLREDVPFLTHFLDCRRHALRILKEQAPSLAELIGQAVA